MQSYRQLPVLNMVLGAPNGEVAAAMQCLLSLVALCEIDTQVTLTAGLHFVDGESSRIEGEHREELEPSIAGLDEQMAPS